ncbi:MAG: SPFH domain-containing protein [Cyanobacteria bacterium P01_A01_bin.83]
MSNSNFDTKFLFQLAQTNPTESSNTINTIDSNSSNLLELPSFNLLSPGGLITGGIAGVLLILATAGFIYTRLYRIIKPNESIIRSGGFGPLWSGKTAFTQGGCVVLPGLHQTISVPLSEVRIQVIRKGKGESDGDQGAVRTKDYLRAKLTATMYVVVDIDSVETAAARLCRDSSGKVTEADIRAAVVARCDDALRNAAKQRTLTEIDSDKVGFGSDVKNSLQQSLDSLGLTLQDVTLTDIEEDAAAYQDNDYFDVQGKREREEKVCQSKLETAKVQSETETQLAAVDRDKALELQTIQLEKEQAEATLEAETTVIKAEKQREAEEGKEQQLALLAKKKESFELEKEQAKIDKQTSIEEAQQDAQKKLLLKQQEVEVADIDRETTVKKAKQTSEQELIVKRQEVLVADQEARQEVAKSEKQTNEIQAQVATAESAIMTATEIEVAERNKQIAELLAAQQANARKIQQETDALAKAESLKIEASAEANAQKIKAQGDLAAANDTAQSIVVIAEAKKEEKLKLAEGELEYIKAINSKEEIIITAELLKELAPDLVKQLPQIAQNLTPEVKEAKLYSFGNGDNSSSGATKQLASISGLGMLQEILDSNVGSQTVSALTKFLNSKAVEGDEQIKIKNSYQ